MPFAQGSKIVCNPCGFVEDSYVCTNAKNFAYEHQETERHKTAMPIWGKKLEKEFRKRAHEASRRKQGEIKTENSK